jgi:hypothetical protein
MLIDSPIISRASGSLAGLTFYMGKGGLTARARTMPVNPSSAAQGNVRGAFGLCVQRWIDTLTDDQREKWSTYAANVALTNPLGDPINVSGMNMYVRCNSVRNRVGLPFVDEGPAIFDLGEYSPPVIDISGGDKSISVAFVDTDEWVDEDDSAMLVQTSPEQNPTVNFLKTPFRRAQEIDGDSVTAPTSPAILTGQFFHTIGNAQFWRIRVTRADGRLSQVTSGRNIVTA